MHKAGNMHAGPVTCTSIVISQRRCEAVDLALLLRSLVRAVSLSHDIKGKLT